MSGAMATSERPFQPASPRGLDGQRPGLFRAGQTVSTREPARARPRLQEFGIVAGAVSTREPARARPLQSVVSASRDAGFQPASPRGLDPSRSPRLTLGICFNPRAREGSTANWTRRPRRPCSFNPRAREGSTDQAGYMGLAFEVSTREPARARPVPSAKARSVYAMFQPASPRGLDDQVGLFCAAVVVFQPASPRGLDMYFG